MLHAAHLAALAALEEGSIGFQVYASQDIGTQNIPGNSYASGNFGGGLPPSPTGSVTEKVRGWLFRHVTENWLPWSYAVANRYLLPSNPTRAWQSPTMFDANSEAITRPGPWPSSQRPFPYPWMTGVVSGFMIMLDSYSEAWAWGKAPSGPGVLTPTPIPFDQQFPGLPKITG